MKYITSGRDRNLFSRSYDMLRKRSQRNISVDRTTDEHEAYVRGVRDALNHVRELVAEAVK